MLEILKHLIITEIVEIVVAYALGITEKKNIILIFMINAITNITLNALLIFVVSKQVLYLSGYTGISIFIWYNTIVIVLEIIIVFIEAAFYYDNVDLSNKYIFNIKIDKFGSYLLISLILNISSIIVGRLID